MINEIPLILNKLLFQFYSVDYYCKKKNQGLLALKQRVYLCVWIVFLVIEVEGVDSVTLMDLNFYFLG